MQSSFIVVHNQQEVGPLTETEVRERLTRGDLLPIDYYYDEALGDWALVETRFTPLVPGDSTQITATDIPIATAPYPAPPDVPPPQEQVARRIVRPATTPPPTVPTPVKPVMNQEKKTAAQNKVSAEQKVISPPPPTPTPSVIAIPPTPPAKSREPSPELTAAESRSERVEMVGGVTTVSLKQIRAGVVVVRLKEPTDKSIRSSAPAHIEVKPGKAAAIAWNCQSQITAGQMFSIEVTCKDNFGNASDQFEGDMELTLKGKHTRTEKLRILGGKARVDSKWNLAEVVELELNDPADSGLALPPNKTITVKPGPVAQILMEAPEQIEAGAPLAVTIKAVDEFGNLVPDYKGEVEIEVEESSRAKAG